MEKKINELLMVSIHDKKADIYNTPFTVRTFGEAERALRTLCADKTTTPGLYPEDFEIVRIGTWNPDTGDFVSLMHVVVFSGDMLRNSNE